MHRCRLISRLRSSGSCSRIPCSSTPLVASHVYRSCFLTRFRSSPGSCRAFIHSSVSRPWRRTAELVMLFIATLSSALNVKTALGKVAIFGRTDSDTSVFLSQRKPVPTICYVAQASANGTIEAFIPRRQKLDGSAWVLGRPPVTSGMCGSPTWRRISSNRALSDWRKVWMLPTRSAKRTSPTSATTMHKMFSPGKLLVFRLLPNELSGRRRSQGSTVGSEEGKRK